MVASDDVKNFQKFRIPSIM